VQPHCEAARRQRPGDFPNLSEILPATAQQYLAFVVASRGEVLVRQRPANGVNAHLWEFPNTRVLLRNEDPADMFRLVFPVAPKTLQPLAVVKHSITRYRITLTAYLATVARRHPWMEGKWVKLNRLSRLAFTAAHKKLASAAAKSILSAE
jgi:adenine-specific DNA glycosylase